MKHVMNILILLILTGLVLGISWATWNCTAAKNAWFILYIPWLVLTIMFGFKIDKDY